MLYQKNQDTQVYHLLLLYSNNQETFSSVLYRQREDRNLFVQALETSRCQIFVKKSQGQNPYQRLHGIFQLDSCQLFGKRYQPRKWPIPVVSNVVSSNGVKLSISTLIPRRHLHQDKQCMLYELYTFFKATKGKIHHVTSNVVIGS